VNLVTTNGLYNPRVFELKTVEGMVFVIEQGRRGEVDERSQRQYPDDHLERGHSLEQQRPVPIQPLPVGWKLAGGIAPISSLTNQRLDQLSTGDISFVIRPAGR
jgi:hypothetical protein